jgi:two-component system chemotaxis sensor kinase CheA
VAKDPYRYFRVEGPELVGQLLAAALELERRPSPEVVARLLRLAHTLKGAARVVKQAEVAERSHALEDALEPFRAGNALVPRDQIERILQIVDEASALIAALPGPIDVPVPVADPGPASASASTAPAPAATPPPVEPLRTVRADVGDVDVLLRGVQGSRSRLGALRRLQPQAERARELARAAHVHLERRGPDRDDRKLSAWLDELRGLLAQTADVLATAVEGVDVELRQVHEAAEQLRLVPAAILFGGLERTARDAALALGKSIAFEARGGDARLDAHVLDGIQAALVQLVRNAVAHGIELPAERRNAGKPAEGRIAVTVARRGHRVAFACRDDGRGVDVDAVRKEVGRQDPDASDAGPDDLVKRLLRGGISTSASVTEHAGRGIGLDVAREAAERLGGTVSIQTAPGTGTTVEIVVPLSLASVDVLAVEVGERVVLLPLDAIRQTTRASAEDVTITAAGESILLGDRQLPFVRLHRFFSDPRASVARGWSVVVIEGAAGPAALACDHLRGISATIVRALPEHAVATPIVDGVALDGEGNPQLVLDLDAVVAHALGGSAPLAPPGPGAPVLVVDDSLTTRMLEQAILESAGYVVHTATSGEQGLEMARAGRYALILVDVEMPGMDGFTFVEQVRADPALHAIPALLVTSRDAPEDRRRGETVGANGYIVKGEFDQVDLLDRIRRLVPS